MDNKAMILRTAVELFSKKGFDSVGVQEIALSSGVTKPTLYHYYKSKENLLRSIFDEYFVIFSEKINDHSLCEGGLETKLIQFSKCIFSFAQDHQDFYRMMLSFSFAPPDNPASKHARQYQRKIFDITHDIFQVSEELNGRSPGQMVAISATFIGHIHTYISLMFYEDIILDSSAIQWATHQFINGIIP